MGLRRGTIWVIVIGVTTALLASGVLTLGWEVTSWIAGIGSLVAAILALAVSQTSQSHQHRSSVCQKCQTVHSSPLYRLVHLLRASPEWLGIRQAFGVVTSQHSKKTPGLLSNYIPRDFDYQLHAKLSDCRENGGFVLLVGWPSAGKTRSLYEGVKTVLRDSRILLADNANGIRCALNNGKIRRRTIVWLDEVQNFIGHNPEVNLRRVEVMSLLAKGAVLVGTMSPDRYERVVLARQNHVLEPAATFELAGEPIYVPDTLSSGEKERAATLAASDSLLASALIDPQLGIIQTLAGAPLLINRYKCANSFERAVLNAAIDAHRVDAGEYLPGNVLKELASLYLPPLGGEDPPTDWFDRAIRHLTAPLANSLSAIHKHAHHHNDKPKTMFYSLARYLMKYTLTEHRNIEIPMGVWDVLARGLTDGAVLVSVGDSARDRGLTEEALLFYQKAITADNDTAHLSLASLLAEQGKPEEAIKQYRTAISVGNPDARILLAGLLADCGRTNEAVSEYRAALISGDESASYWLAGLEATE